MRQFTEYKIVDSIAFKNKLLHWSGKYETVCYLDSNKNSPPYFQGGVGGGSEKQASPFETQVNDLIVAVGSVGDLKIKGDSFESLKTFHSSTNDWIFGHFAYDLKNEIEALSSENADKILFPSIYFFQPQFIFILRDSILKIGYLKSQFSEKEMDGLFNEILNFNPHLNDGKKAINVLSRISREQYVKAVNSLKEHIHKGDIYEVNFCHEYYAQNVLIDPIETYKKLNSISQAPFSAFYGLDGKYLMCASPERFLKKTGERIISQPIKGTIKRGKSNQEDQELKKLLFNDEKERSENVMIVDLVRNDLSKTAKRGSVRVEELCGIYSFPQLHQMISTISSELKEDVHFIDIIKNAFPMGSMTGAPKISAMQLIEQYESTKRGLYSGTVGYITPAGDFDFNVVIRSILYNANEQYLSFMVGSAITEKSIAEKEYEECLLKAKAMFEVLQ